MYAIIADGVISCHVLCSPKVKQTGKGGSAVSGKELGARGDHQRYLLLHLTLKALELLSQLENLLL